jgi:type 1 glutamine amidotransferase/nicotinamidase-related amidase
MQRLSSLLVIALVAAIGAHANEVSPLKVCLVSGSFEYESDKSLTSFKNFLESQYNAECILLTAPDRFHLPGLEGLEDCEAALFFTRRSMIKGESLEMVKAYVASGKPIVAVRTASHGFQRWLEFDKEVLGGSYGGHYGNDVTQTATVVPEMHDHPILQGVTKISSPYSLYKNPNNASDTVTLMYSQTPEGREPAAWSRDYNGARVFYTSLGGRQDFENDTFKRMVANALFWAADHKMQRAELPTPARREMHEGTLELSVRTWASESGTWKEAVIEKKLPVAETAILICDMWDKHWCSGATERVDALAKKMEPVLQAARAKGVQIIHAPSETLDFYADTPQRRRALLAPRVQLPRETPAPDEPPLPIDDSDGGCTSDETTQYQAWTRQHPAISIEEPDIISDNGREIYNYLAQEGIQNIIYMGVHTNMCVLNRSFGIRRVSRLGFECFLVRDLTDAMYDPRDPPHVTHDEGTELVVQHIEKYWCPSLTSEDLLEGLP